MVRIIDLDEWYNTSQASERLTANSGKRVDESYVRTLARYNKITPLKLSEQCSLYLKADIDAYIVEERGVKAGRVKRQKAVESKQGND